MKTLRATTQAELDKVLSENKNGDFHLDLTHFKTTNDLDLSGLKLKGYLDLDNAKIGGYLDLRYSKIANSLHLENTEIGGYLNVIGIEIWDDLHLNDAIIKGYLDLDNAKIGGYFDLDNTKIGDNLNLCNSEIGGSFNIGNAEIGGEIKASYTQKDIDFLKSLPLQIIDLKTWQSNKNWLKAKNLEDLHTCGTTYCVRGYAEAQYYVEHGKKIKNKDTLYPNLKHLFYMTNQQFLKEREYIINL